MARAATLATRVAEVLPATQVRLINPLVYCNMDKLADDRFRRKLHWFNAARDHDQPAVWLGQYGPDTVLSGDSPFPLLSGGELVDDQVVLAENEQARLREAILRRRADIVSVNRPCLLACRQGEWTWGHWLLDMLPKIVLAERMAPRRFTFAVPGAITQRALNPRYVGAVTESLAAYGIDASRLLCIQVGGLYKFENLYDIIDIVWDGMHPGVIAAMQAGVDVPSAPRRRLTAVMRGNGDHRRVVNSSDIDACLTAAGAARVDPSSASFVEQVQAFRDSDTIVGDLGSNLAASIYAWPETGIVTLAPSGWDDAFFVHTFQRQYVRHADIRGVAVPRDTRAIGHAPYLVDAGHFEEGLQTALARDGSGLPMAAGRLIARAPGPAVWQLRFGIGGNAAPSQVDGFSAPEAEWTWSLGPSCTLELRQFPVPAEHCWLEVFGVGFTAAPHLVSRPLGIVINDVLRADFDMDDLTRVHVAVPKDVVRARPGMKIVFHHPFCPSPLAVGSGQDARPLGFRFRHVALRIA